MIVAIPTYNRPQLLIKVLQTIPKDCEVLIFQDGCNSDYTECKEWLKDYKHSWYKYKTPHGKKLLWALYNDIWQIIKEKKFDLIHFLQDDTIPTADYWNLTRIMFATNNDIEVISTFTIEAHRLLFYKRSALMDFGRYKLHNLDKIDCVFVCNKAFFERLEWEVKPVPTDFDFGNGSGVGYYMSHRYLHAGGKTLNVFPSLLIHEGSISVIGNNLPFEAVTSILPNEEDKKREIIIKEKNIHQTERVVNEGIIVKYDSGRVIWSLDSSYAGVSFIADYLNAKVIMYNRMREDFDKMFYDFITYVDNKEQTLEYLTNAKELLLFGAKGVQYLLPILDKIGKKLADYKVTMIITDHWYFKDKYLNGDRINNALKQCKDVKYLFMPDCVKFKADFIKDYSLYYQYLPVPEFEIKKQLKVSHSAGLKVESDEKGTSIIRKLCKSLDIELDVLSGLAWNKCVEKKAEAMIFIDQIISNERAKQMKIDGYGGGIGKSGLEAMKLGGVVLTSGELVGNKTLPKAPIILINENNAKEKLTKILKLPKKELVSIGQKNKEWADKYTGFNFVLNNIDDKIQRCSCISVSSTLLGFKTRMKKKYKLKEYNKHKPTLFFGMYLQEDYELLKNHKSKAVILFAGTDVDYFGKVYKSRYLEFIIKHRIIAISENVKMRLLDYGLESEFIPICPTPIQKNVLPKNRARCVYFYGNGIKYGEQFIDEIQKRIKFEIIKTTNGKYSQKEIQEFYKKSFIGLRLTPKDGLSNTVIEMGLAGRRVVYNSNPLPNALKWESIDDVVRLINEEYKKRDEDCNIIADEMYEYMKYKDFWLFT
jgi:hypothetical protein